MLPETKILNSAESKNPTVGERDDLIEVTMWKESRDANHPTRTTMLRKGIPVAMIVAADVTVANGKGMWMPCDETAYGAGPPVVGGLGIAHARGILWSEVDMLDSSGTNVNKKAVVLIGGKVKESSIVVNYSGTGLGYGGQDNDALEIQDVLNDLTDKLCSKTGTNRGAGHDRGGAAVVKSAGTNILVAGGATTVP